MRFHYITQELQIQPYFVNIFENLLPGRERPAKIAHRRGSAHTQIRQNGKVDFT